MTRYPIPAHQIHVVQATRTLQNGLPVVAVDGELFVVVQEFE